MGLIWQLDIKAIGFSLNVTIFWENGLVYILPNAVQILRIIFDQIQFIEEKC
jgi:hypothetical protein